MPPEPARLPQEAPRLYAAIVRGGAAGTDVTLAPSAEAARAYLRNRAATWDPADYPLLADIADLRTATVEQLSSVYSDGDPDDQTGIAIGVVWGVYDPQTEPGRVGIASERRHGSDTNAAPTAAPAGRHTRRRGEFP